MACLNFPVNTISKMIIFIYVKGLLRKAHFSKCYLDTIKTKTLKLEEGIPQILGRSLAAVSASSVNGLFEVKSTEICHQHAFIMYAKNQFFLEDTSINGTYLNGHKICKNNQYIIISGDIIQLGGESFSLQVDFRLITFTVKLFTPDDADFINIFLLKKQYDIPLQLSNEIPNFECSLSVLHKFVSDRFEAFKILDSLGNINLLTDKLINWILKKFIEKGLHDMIKLIRGESCSYEEEYNLRKMDHISHFMLSVTCCRNYVMKKWFLDQENKLLLLRWKFLTENEKYKIISECFSCYKEVTGYEKIEAAKTSNGIIDSSLKYYKVFFTDVSELIANRMVFINNGSCYVPLNDFVYVIKCNFLKYMKFNLENIRKNLHRVWSDERIISMISYVEKEVQFNKFLFGKKSNSSVLLKEIDFLAEKSFPLCMNVLHSHLKKNSHLRNSGRFQYGLFLKGIGLSLQDSQTFWRYHLTKKMTINEFMKHYDYHIFHIYGAIGKKADYPPQSCKKIFEAVPTFSEYHGCPFKLLDEENISNLLKRLDVNTEDIKCIVDIMKNNMPQLACSKYFEIKHGSPLRETVFHPNIYFEESRNLLKTRTESKLVSSVGKSINQNQIIKSCTDNKKNRAHRCCNSIYEW